MSPSGQPRRPPAAAPAEGAPLRTFGVRVLGCKVNQYEAAQAEHLLRQAGLTPAAPGTAPDVMVLHTCAVTSAALRKSAQLARRLAAEARCVLLSGCGVAGGLDVKGMAIEASVPSGPGWLDRLAEAVAALPLPKSPAAASDGLLDHFPGHTRAFLKIQDGCDRRCAYCIVPALRAAPRDKPLPDILREAQALVRNGHRELVLTGVCVGLWGRGGPAGLADVVRAVAALPGVTRLRLSSLHPEDLTPRLLDAWAEHPSLMPHFHLPLQSGSDRILAAMRRGYTAGEFLDAVARIRARVPDPALTTDVIAGFPGETDADFDATLSVGRAAGFSRVHAFSFSPRPGTPAAEAAGTVPAEVIHARVQRLRTAAGEWARAFHRRFDGVSAQVICETRDDRTGEWEGYTERYIPVHFKGPAGWQGRVLEVRLGHPTTAGLRGTPVTP